MPSRFFYLLLTSVLKLSVIRPYSQRTNPVSCITADMLSVLMSVGPGARMVTVCPHCGQGHRNSKLAPVSQKNCFHVDKDSCQTVGKVRLKRSKVGTQCRSQS